jgi:hypothetical protein
VSDTVLKPQGFTRVKAVLTKVKTVLAWGWSHRTKAIGGIGTAAAYAYANQEQLGLIIPAKSLGHTMLIIGIVTFLIGLFNTVTRKDEDRV